MTTTSFTPAGRNRRLRCWPLPTGLEPSLQAVGCDSSDQGSRATRSSLSGSWPEGYSRRPRAAATRSPSARSDVV